MLQTILTLLEIIVNTDNRDCADIETISID